MRPDSFGSASGLLVAAAAALAAAGEEGGPAGAERPVDLHVIPGFDGRILDPRRFPLVIEIENATGEDVRGGLAIDTGSGQAVPIAKDVDVPAGTTIRRRVIAELPGAGDRGLPIRILFTSGSLLLEADVPAQPPEEAAVIVVREAGGYVYPPIAIEGRRIVPPFLLVPVTVEYIPRPVVGCRPAYLPVETSSYERVLSVVLCDADPVRWEIEQVKALEEYVRRGGTLVIEGGERGKYLAISPIVSRWLVGNGSPVADSKGDPIADAFPLGLGTVLRSRMELARILERPAKAGTDKEGVEDAAVRRLLVERPFSSHELPWGEGMIGVTNELTWAMRESSTWGGFPLCAGYFLLLIVWLAAGVVWGLKKRAGLRLILALAAITAAFTAAVPLLFAVLGRQPYAMSILRTIRYGPDGKGVEVVAAGIRSGGATGARFSISGKDIVARVVKLRPESGPASFVRTPPLLRHASELTVDLPLRRWESAGLLALSDAKDPPPLAAAATFDPENVENPLIHVSARRNPRFSGTIIATQDVAVRFGAARGGPLDSLIRKTGDWRFWTGAAFRIPGITPNERGPSGDPGYDLLDLFINDGALNAGEEWSPFVWPPTPPARGADPAAPSGPAIESASDPMGWILLSYWVIPPRGMSIAGEGVRVDAEEACLVQQMVPIRRAPAGASNEEKP